MGKGDQCQNYKCEPLMHQVEQWALEASALSRGAVQLSSDYPVPWKKTSLSWQNAPQNENTLLLSSAS